MKKEKTEVKTHTFAICQNCGYSWKPDEKDTKTAKITKTGKIIIAAALFFFVILCMLVNTFSDRGDSTALSEQDPNAIYTQAAEAVFAGMTQTAAGDPNAIRTQVAGTLFAEAAQATNTPYPTAPSFRDIEATQANMTEVQWKEYLPSLEGLRIVNWSGWVMDVDKNFGNNYKIWVDMDDPSVLVSVQDVYLNGISEEDAMKINKDAQIHFSGTISSITEVLGTLIFNIEDVSFQSESIQEAASGVEIVEEVDSQQSFKDGTWQVGTNIQPGIYRTEGSIFCYWERLSGFGGTIDEIISNETLSGPGVVLILPSDAGFSSSGCGTWILQTEQIIAATVPQSSFGDGIWRVGIDIQAGTYSTDGSDFCYWERSSGFGGTINEIISNETLTGPGVLTVSPSDAGISSSGCGTWVLQQ